MGHILTIESDEAAAIAAELAALTGEGLTSLVTGALRQRLVAEQQRRAWIAGMMAETDEFAGLLDNPLPGSDHGWLYDDETGLPV